MKLDLNDYQNKAMATAVFPKEYGDVYTALALNGEAGELAELVKKKIRGDYDDRLEELRQKLKLELGDVLWYVAACATVWGFELGDVANSNLDKLADRHKRNVIKGSGDNR